MATLTVILCFSLVQASFTSFDLEACRSKLAERYRRINPAFSLKAPAVDVSLVRQSRNADGLTQNVLAVWESPLQVDYRHLFTANIHDAAAKRILVQGPAGIGKTMFTRKLAYDWATELASEEPTNGQVAVLKNFELLIAINLKDVANYQSLQDALNNANIFEDEDKFLTQGLLNYVTNKQEKVLFVFDGYDEYRCGCNSELYEIFTRGKLRNCCVLLTSRLSEADELRKFEDLLVKVSRA